MSYSLSVKCKDCSGSALKYHFSKARLVKCESCSGTGWVKSKVASVCNQHDSLSSLSCANNMINNQITLNEPVVEPVIEAIAAPIAKKKGRPCKKKTSLI